MKINFLRGVKVVEMGRVLSAPYAAKLLSDMGAEVTKIETENGDPYRHMPPFIDGESIWFQNFNFGKKTLRIDNLKNWSKNEEVVKSIKNADIFIENFRPGILAKVGLDYKSLKKINSKVVYTSISAFGQEGSLRDRPGYDIIVQALAGYLYDYSSGRAIHPHIYLSDYASGLMAAFSSIGALQSGQSVHIDISMFDILVHWSSINDLVLYYDESFYERIFTMDPVAFPYGIFDSLDGKKIVIAAVGENMVKKFYNAFKETFEENSIDFNDFLSPDRMIELNKKVSTIFKKMKIDEIKRRLDENEIPCEYVKTAKSLLNSTNVLERKLYEEVYTNGKKIKISRIPVIVNEY